MKSIINKVLIYIIILMAIITRLVFVNKSDIGLFQYDMGLYNSLNSEEDYNRVYTDFDKDKMAFSHIHYIMYLYTYNSLPNTNEIIGQFYHPPLHHFIMATWLKIADIFSNTSSVKLESMQYVTVMYSIIILISLYKILKELEVDEKYRIIPMLLFGFYPLYIYLAGSINNDELVTMFCILSFLYLVKWEKKQSYKNVVLISIFIGLGLMTKTSAVIMIIPAIYIYFKKMSEYINEEKSVKKLIYQLIIFSIILIVLGGWFHIINGFKTITIYPPKETLRVTTDNIWDRFGISSLLTANKYNIWNYLLYSSITFETFSSENLIMKVLVVLAFILILNIVYYSFKYFKQNMLINITILSWFIFYIYLQISLPYECSMHSRYMIVPISLGIITLGKGMQNEKNKIIICQIVAVAMILAVLSMELMLGQWG